MGNKSGRLHKESSSSLNPNERRRLTTFLESRGSKSQFDHGIMQNLWHELLTPELLQRYTVYLMKQDVAKKSFIGVEEFVALYSNLVRGTVEEKALTLANVIGANTNSSGQSTVSYKTLVKYLSELLESYFLGLKNRNDPDYKSWTHSKQPEKHISEQIMVGITTELTKMGDEVDVSELERWLHYCGVVSVLHMYVLGSMYNLEPEISAAIIPRAVLPTQKTPVFLDLAQVAFLNTYLPQDHKETWRFLFSTVSHGESFSKFVGCIINQGPLLLVIESNDGSVFGGFISESINVGPKWVGTGDSFLYRLRPTVEVYASTGYNDHYTYLNTSQASLPNGLGMGGQHNFWGLFISSHFGDGECSESCTTYKNYKQLCNKKKFTFAKLEAWAVGEPPLSAADLGERSQVSILDKDPATSHILEMAGRKVYSKGLREENPES